MLFNLIRGLIKNHNNFKTYFLLFPSLPFLKNNYFLPTLISINTPEHAVAECNCKQWTLAVGASDLLNS